MTTHYNLNAVYKRIIQRFEDAVIGVTLSKSGLLLDYNEETEVNNDYREAKIQLIDLIGEMDEQLYGKNKGLASRAAKRNPARKKQNHRHEVQCRADKNRSLAVAKLKQKKKARIGNHK